MRAFEPVCSYLHMLTKRLQVLIDEERLARLRRESARQGAPVGELVRRAIDREYPPVGDAAARAEAAASLLAAELPPGPEPEWSVQKQELLDERGAGDVPRASG